MAGEAGRTDCTVIIVGYNSADTIEAVLDSLVGAADGITFKCMLVDNESTDDTVEIARRRSDVRVIEAGQNLGYSGAINLGRNAADPRSAVLVLNPDLVLERDAIKHLYDALKDPGVGAAVPKLLTAGGDLYPTLRREPSITRALGDALLGSYVPHRPAWLSETVRDISKYDVAHDASWAAGAAVIVSAECNRTVGDWDDARFFLYSEETDYAHRVRQAGYRFRYVPTAIARHEEGGSGRSSALAALLAVNRIRFYEKYHRAPATLLFRLVVILHYALRARDVSNRRALAILVRRRKWSELPGGVSG
jgi:GT2 family glycosyltransferase